MEPHVGRLQAQYCAALQGHLSIGLADEEDPEVCLAYEFPSFTLSRQPPYVDKVKLDTRTRC
jgi:hypothetical protein